jgi:hypothetical protein
VPTSKRPQIDDVQYPRISSKVLEGTLREDVVNDDVVSVVAMSVTGRR